MFQNSYFQRWFLIIFGLFCIGINVVAFVLYQKTQKVNDSKQWIAHTYQVITEEYKLFSALQDMQTAQRGYLIAGTENFLEPFNQSKKDAQIALASLEELTADNPSQKEELVGYDADIQQVFGILQEQIDFKRNGIQGEIDIVINKELMDRIRLHHRRIVENEQKLLERRKIAEERSRKNYITTLFVTAGLSALGLLLANGLVAFLTYRRKDAEDHLRRTNKEMEGFTYIASHDLRSPLVNLKGFSTEMKYSVDELRPLLERGMEVLTDSEKKKAIEIVDKDIPDALRYIHSSVEKMDKLTNAILELSRIGRRSMEVKTVDTGKIVRHVLDTFHHSITNKNIKITVGTLPTVVADALSIEQVFSNVIDNAIKYMDPSRQGQIEIGGERNYREVKYWVKDNGRGISANDFQKIFEIYRRAGNTETIPGEGMGMAYVRTTLRRMGGQIWCESTPGQGSIFYFTISNSLKKEDK